MEVEDSSADKEDDHDQDDDVINDAEEIAAGNITGKYTLNLQMLIFILHTDFIGTTKLCMNSLDYLSY